MLRYISLLLLIGCTTPIEEKAKPRFGDRIYFLFSKTNEFYSSCQDNGIVTDVVGYVNLKYAVYTYCPLIDTIRLIWIESNDIEWVYRR